MIAFQFPSPTSVGSARSQVTDGKPARFVFLLLIPTKEYDVEVRILGSIARATYDARGRAELGAAAGIEEVTRVLSESARRTRESIRPPRKARSSPEARRKPSR